MGLSKNGWTNYKIRHTKRGTAKRNRTLSGDLTRKSWYSPMAPGGSLCTAVWYLLYSANERSKVRRNSSLAVAIVTSFAGLIMANFYGAKISKSQSREEQKEEKREKRRKIR